MKIDGINSSSVMQKPSSNSGESYVLRGIENQKTVEIPQQGNSSAEQKSFNEGELIKAIESANKSLNVYDRKLEFAIHERTKEVMVKVIDTNTDEIIREIPPERVLDRVAKLWEMAGIIVDKKA